MKHAAACASVLCLLTSQTVHAQPEPDPRNWYQAWRTHQHHGFDFSYLCENSEWVRSQQVIDPGNEGKVTHPDKNGHGKFAEYGRDRCGESPGSYGPDHPRDKTGCHDPLRIRRYVLAHCPPSQDAIEIYQKAKAEQQGEKLQVEAAHKTQYVAYVVIYAPNGIMMGGGEGDVFTSAKDCDRFTAARIKDSIDGAGPEGARLLGDSVVSYNDVSGYRWFGCIRRDQGDAELGYVNRQMSIEVGKTMKRFPNFDSSLQPATTPPSRRGTHLKI